MNGRIWTSQKILPNDVLSSIPYVYDRVAVSREAGTQPFNLKPDRRSIREADYQNSGMQSAAHHVVEEIFAIRTYVGPSRETGDH